MPFICPLHLNYYLLGTIDMIEKKTAYNFISIPKQIDHVDITRADRVTIKLILI